MTLSAERFNMRQRAKDAEKAARKTTEPAALTAAQLHGLLSHPDAQVRSLADWTREYRGFGTRGLSGDQYSVDAARMERQLVERLAFLARDYAALQNDLSR